MTLVHTFTLPMTFKFKYFRNLLQKPKLALNLNALSTNYGALMSMLLRNKIMKEKIEKVFSLRQPRNLALGCALPCPILSTKIILTPQDRRACRFYGALHN